MFTFFKRSFYNSEMSSLIIDGDSKLDRMKIYVREHSIDVTKKHSGNYLLSTATLIQTGSMSSRFDTVKFLLDSGANPLDTIDTLSDNEPLPKKLLTRSRFPFLVLMFFHEKFGKQVQEYFNQLDISSIKSKYAMIDWLTNLKDFSSGYHISDNQTKLKIIEKALSETISCKENIGNSYPFRNIVSSEFLKLRDYLIELKSLLNSPTLRVERPCQPYEAGSSSLNKGDDFEYQLLIDSTKSLKI